jgi:predicted HD phosphohydrolase
MTEAEFEAYMKHEFTQEEHDERVARMKAWDEELHQANLESPLPDDFIDYVKGRKFFRQTVAL